jgi:hypothetical protein
MRLRSPRAVTGCLGGRGRLGRITPRGQGQIAAFNLSSHSSPQVVLPHSLPGLAGGSGPDFRCEVLFFSQYPFRLLCKCTQTVHQGQVWANREQMQYLVEALSQVPSLHMVNREEYDG